MEEDVRGRGSGLRKGGPLVREAGQRFVCKREGE